MMISRTQILKSWQGAFEQANLVTGTAEAQACIAQCAAREVEARIHAGVVGGREVHENYPIGSN